MSIRHWRLIRYWRPGLNRGRPRIGGLEWAFLGIVVVAAAMRLWELNGRAMHYDEAIHLHFAWKLANGVGFAHSPWMHGPLQIELVAALLRFVADTDFIARLPYALFGVVLSGLPYFLRDRIGDKGAVCAAAILTMSPSLLYFSRFGAQRHSDGGMGDAAADTVLALYRRASQSLPLRDGADTGVDAGDERDGVFHHPVSGRSRAGSGISAVPGAGYKTAPLDAAQWSGRAISYSCPP